ncbi:MAG TPA: amidohydrolase [Candidatus Acidoferrum sp.]|nr:amidohydrolase [Candidatus Acidoferrum sp.]
MSLQWLPVRSLAMDKSSSLSLFLSSKVRTSLWLAGTAMLFAATSAAQLLAGAHAQLLQLVDKDAASWQHVSKQIWDFAELGYHETRSSELLQQQLEAAGFKVQAGVANEPTAFIASYGEGKPVVAILGEFDALPGLSQQTVPTRDPVKADAPGHGCGHNLLGAGAALAAVALKQYMEAHHITGTLRYYGTPAEEGGSGKVYMVRDGAFKDVDVVLHWHPGDSNGVSNGGELAMVSAKFTFHGIAAHAAMAPDRGRSALDAVMLMGNGVEFMREHVPSHTRIHYIISKGGVAPNVVPDLAQMDLIARSPFNTTLKDVWEWIQNIAKGATLMTGTTLDVSGVGSYANIVPNDPLAAVAQKNLEEVGGYKMNADEQKFALELQKTLKMDKAPSLNTTNEIEPLRKFDPNEPGASTDVGDVSWKVPTIGFSTATFVPGSGAHTWQATAAAGMSIGQQGMVVAAKAIALTGLDLLTDPRLVQAAKDDFKKQTAGRSYYTAIPPDQKPPLNYRSE